jgi:ketosteroid isomerase-like protein
MSRENVERFVASTEAFNRGDVEAWLKPYATEVVFEPQIAAVEGASLGRDGMRAFAAAIGDLYDRFQARFHDVRDLGDTVLALGDANSIGRGSGIRMDQPLAIVASFRDGRIVHFKDYGNEAEALEAVGLSD